jgi:Tol biopolymer transport system component
MAMKRSHAGYLCALIALAAHAGTIGSVSRSAPDSVFLSANGASDTARQYAMSEDGSKVVFASSATNLVPNQLDVNGQPDVFLLDRGTGVIKLITHRFDDVAGTANGSALVPIISANGARVAFLSTATNLTDEALPSDSSIRLFEYDVAGDTLTHVDRRLGDPTISDPSFAGTPGLSSDGNWLVFGSSAVDLVQDQADGNNSNDVFLYHATNHSLRLVSHTPQLFSDSETGDGGSGLARISADGRYIAYASSAGNLVNGLQDFNADGTDIFVFDRDAGSNSTALVSHSSLGNLATANQASSNPTISADGSAIAFTTQATNLVSGITDGNGDSDVYVYDRATHALTLVSHNQNSNSVTSVMYSGNPSLSPNGRYVLHTSSSADAVPGQVDGSRSDDLFLFDRTTSNLALLSHVAGSPTTAASHETPYGFFSADGAHIVMMSRGYNMVPGQVDTNDDDDFLLGDDVFLADPLNPGANQRLLSHAPGQPAVAGLRMSYTPSVNADASLATYVSQSDELPGPGQDANSATDVLLWNSATDVSTLLTRHASGASNATLMGASQVQVSRDGNWVAFVSASPHVVANEIDTNRTTDVYLLERASGTVRLVSHTPGNHLQTGNAGIVATGSNNISISADGRYVAFETMASDLDTTQIDNNTSPDILLFDRDAPPDASLRVASRRPSGIVSNGSSTVPRLAANGGAVVFLSTSTNLVPGVVDTNGEADLFRYDVATATVKLISHSSASATVTADGGARAGTLSADGRYVAYLDSATNLVPGSDSNGYYDVFVYDVQSDTHQLVTHTFGSATTSASAAGAFSVEPTPTISGDGSTVVYASEATDLVSLFQNNIFFPVGAPTQVYRWNRNDNSNRLLSRVPDGFGNPSGNGPAGLPSVSSDGSRVAFASSAGDLVAGQDDSELTDDVFLWSGADDSLRLVSHRTAQPASAAGCSRDMPRLSAEGLRLIYGCDDAMVAAGVILADSQSRLFLYSVAADVNVLISPNVFDAHFGAHDYAERADVDGNGTSIVYLSPSPDLITYDGNAFADAFVFRRATGQPQIATPGDLTSPEDTAAGPLTVTVSDPDTATADLALSVSSSDPNLLPAENVAVVPTAGGFTLTATPVAEGSGSVTLSLKVVDGDANAASASFMLTWIAVNDAPELAAPADQATDEDVVLGPLDVFVDDVESGPDDITLTAASSNQAIVPDAGLIFDGSGSSRTLVVKPAQDAFGTVTITLTAHDPQGGGPSTVSSFELVIAPLNDVPFVIAPLNTHIDENGHSTALYFALADVESAPEVLTLTIQASDETLLPPGAFTVEGTGSIRVLHIEPAANATGTATVSLVVSDPQGASRGASFQVTVDPVSDAIFQNGFEVPTP